MTAAHWALGTWNKAVHQYIALTAYVRDQLVAGRFPADRISIKPNFVVEPRSVARASSSGDYFIYVGRLAIEKGLAVLFDAWNLNKQATTLKIVGGGSVPSRLAVPRNVQLLGEKSVVETYALIAGAKALILPAQWAEPFGRVVIEAFALGTPVISSKAGALGELIEHEVTGLLVNAGSAQELAAAVDRLAVDSSLRARLSAQAREKYAESFTDQANCAMLVSIYERALEMRKRDTAR